MIHRVAAAFLPALVLVACTSNSPAAIEESTESAQVSVPASAASSVPSSPVTGLATVDFTVDGGDYAGQYSLTLVGSGGCNRNLGGGNTFGFVGTSYEPATPDIDPSITIFDPAAAASGTDNFQAAFSFDNYLGVEVTPIAANGGDGTLTLDDRGDSATITVEGATRDGFGVTATIECPAVTDY